MEFEVKLPILGFDDIKKMRLEKHDDFFMKVSNAEAETPSFTLINPFAIRGYDFDAPVAVKLLLDLKDNTNLLVLNIMIVNTPIEESTINFLAPLLFNFDNNTMGQIVLDSNKYPQYGITERISQYMDTSGGSESASTNQNQNEPNSKENINQE